MAHVDDMTPPERIAFRNRQVAELVVLANRESLAAVADRVSTFCHTSTQEMLLVAIDQLNLAMFAAGPVPDAVTDLRSAATDQMPPGTVVM